MERDLFDCFDSSKVDSVKFERVSICHDLLRLREICDISISAASKKAGISPNNLSRIESGLFSPPIDVVIRLCRLYGSKLCIFLNYEN